MITIRAYNAEVLFLRGLMVCKDGIQVAPRGLHTIEARESVTFILDDPLRCLVTNPYRKLNYVFGLFESIAMWNGINEVKIFDYYNKEMAKYSDDGEKFFGSYGEEFRAQFRGIVDLLSRDRDSRQAVITLWRRNPPQSKDIPCTVMLHFLVRDFYLNLNVYMRSNDIWLGFPYDITNFSRIQQSLAAELGFKVGVLRHTVGSLHMYAGDIYKTEWAIKYQGATVDIPLMQKGELEHLAGVSFHLRKQFEPWKIEANTFEDINSQLLLQHTYNKLHSSKREYPEPYNSLVKRAKEVHGYFKDSKDEH